MAWHLRKADTKEVFSNRSFEEILKWAHSAQINPFDELSRDGHNWVRASTIPQLEMEWSIHLTDGEIYGPTNIGTIREFLKVNLLRNESIAYHIDGVTTAKVRDLVSGKWNKKNTETKTEKSKKETSLLKKVDFLFHTNKPAPPAPPPSSGPKIRDYHTQPLPKPAYLRIPPPQGVMLPAETEYTPIKDTDPE